MSQSFITPSNPNRVQHAREAILHDALVLPPLQAKANASGVAEVVAEQVQPGELWEVLRITVTSESDAPVAIVYVGEAEDRNERDRTSMGDGDSADYPRGLRVPSAERLRIRWTGAVEGDKCTATVELNKIGYTNVKVNG